MEVQDYGAMGQTVIVAPGDKLSRVPRTHRELITDDVRMVFKDAPGYFAAIADRTPFPRMAEWLRALVKENRWCLILHGNAWGNGRAGFMWRHDSVTGAEIGLPMVQTRHLPESLAALIRLVGFVDWSGYYEGGGCIRHPEPLLFWPENDDGTAKELRIKIDWESALTWGGWNGDVLFAAPNDRAGWLGMSRDVRLLGTVAEAINWWFATLLSNTAPTMDRVRAA